jgi:flagellar basal-body rod protein FlgC
MFESLHIANSGLYVNRKWMDAVSDNLSNLNTVSRNDEDAFQERFIDAVAVDYGTGEGGTTVRGVEFGSAEGRMVYQPDHPLADEEGYVRYPDIDMGDQMVNLMMSQRGYQANLATVDRARESYMSALQIGKG